MRRRLLAAVALALAACPQSIEGIGPDEGTPDAGGGPGADAGAPDGGSACTPVEASDPCASKASGDAIAVFRQGGWIVDRDGDHLYDAHCDEQFNFGRPDDIPLAGDWTGTGRAAPGVFRAGLWILDTDGDRAETGCDRQFTLGSAGDVPLVGHWGPGNALAFGVYTPATGTFGLDLDGSRTLSADEQFSFGGSAYKPVVGDWNGDGRTGIGVARPEAPDNLGWSLDEDDSRGWTAGDSWISFGLSQDVPVTGDWTGTGVTSIGVFRSGGWSLERNLRGNPGDDTNWISFTYGVSGDIPIVFRP